MNLSIEAIQIAESLNIKQLRADFHAEEYAGSASEIFYILGEQNRFLYLFDYGVVVFANYEEVSKNEMLNYLKNYAVNPVTQRYTEAYQIISEKEISRNIVKNNFVATKEISRDILRIVMLNTGQSVALEYYETLTDDLITSSKSYILELEQHGELSISKKNLLKYIGKVLNVKNSIVDNLYILDDPNLVWDNEDLDLLNRQLKTNFDIYSRFKDIDYRLQIVEDNLTLFTDVLNVKESNRLEWIIIILIAIEIALTLLTYPY